MIRTHSIMTVAALALAAGAAQAAVMQLDINSIQVRVGGPFGGTSHTGTLTLSDPATGSLLDILVDGQSVGGAVLGNVIGEIELDNGFVVGGFMNIMDGDNDMYAANIGVGGRVNVQAGRGFRIDRLTFEGFFSNAGQLGDDLHFGNVDVTALFGPRATDETLEGSFLLASFNPDDQGFDSRADLDVFIVPTPGTVALAGLAGIAVVRRKR